ncbi:uncharacterized protein LOC134534310 isoform X4 [Bacillus rossius redtenbacheri]|uniref:uncharacterized protein LOC134534310 isoform X4 n=1 Tax=Bacillus rossius redtenbacheri TaxID=93214 RepID=UPI002FDCB30E
MSFTIKISNRAFRVLSGYLARWVPPILETGFKSGLFIAYAQSNAQEKPLSITQVEIPGMGDVTHRSLIRQACAGSLETSLQLLTFTVNAFSDVSGRYRAAVQRHAGLMTELMEPGVSDLYKQRLWDGVMDARLESQELRTSLQELAGLMDRVTQLATASAEVSFLAGAEFLSSSMCERISSVGREVRAAATLVVSHAGDYCRVQRSEVEGAAVSACWVQSN